jgi:uncharacterized membrane protein
MDTVSRRVREREIQRQLQYNRVRKAVLSRLPALLPEYLRMLLGSVLGFGIVVELLRRYAHVNPLYLLPAIGLVYSAQTAYYKVKLAGDPDFRIPKCRCAGAANDRTEVVLRSKGSAILGIPNFVLGIGLYAALVALVSQHHRAEAEALAIVGVLGSVYLGYVMVVRIAGLCSTCVSLAALNVLILVQFLR